MTFEKLDSYLLSKKGETFDYPFDEKSLRFHLCWVSGVL